MTLQSRIVVTAVLGLMAAYVLLPVYQSDQYVLVGAAAPSGDAVRGVSVPHLRRRRGPQLTVVGAFVSIVPLMLAMVFLQRFLRMGLTQGSVKG